MLDSTLLEKFTISDATRSCRLARASAASTTVRLRSTFRRIACWNTVIDRDSARFLVIEPDRQELVRRIEARFDQMLDKGALDEVRQLTALGLDPDLPAMKAIGVRELQAAMAGRSGFPEAIERAKIATRQYAKRQSTWFRHQLGAEWRRLRPGDEPALLD